MARKLGQLISGPGDRVLKKLMFVLTCTLACGASAADDLSDLVKLVRAAVVRVEVLGSTGSSLGTGFVVHSDGIIATNYHVIEDAISGQVVFEDGESLRIAGVLVIQPDHDMVLLRVNAAEELPTLPISETVPEQGADVFTFGNPKGLRFVVSRGVVSAIATTRELMASDPKLATELRRSYAPDATWIQTDAPISSGNSGGPLIGATGKVVGINTWSRSDGQNLNFAGSALTLQRMMKDIPDAVLPLPRASRASNVRNRPRVAPVLASIALPSGISINPKMFEVANAEVTAGEEAAVDRENFFVIPYPESDQPFAAIQLLNLQGTFHGRCFAYHENGELMLSGRYQNGKRDGVFRWTSAEGQMVCYSTFANGKEHGLVGYFTNGQPSLLVEYKGGNPVWSHRVRDFALRESVRHGQDDSANASEEINKLIEEFSEYVRKRNDNERILKKTVADVTERVRTQLARNRSANMTRVMCQRLYEQAVSADVQLWSMYRSALSKSGF